MKIKVHIVLVSFFSLLFVFQGKSQDVHWSQQQFSQLQYSPAMLGTFKGSLQTTLLYRNQWRTVPVGYRSLAASVERKMGALKGFQSTAGVRILSDQAGDAGLTWTQGEVLGNFSKKISNAIRASVGIGMNFAQRSVDVSKLQFQSQWNGDIYDESAPNGESFRASSGLVASLQTGAAIHLTPSYKNNRSRMSVFMGLYNFNRPMVSFDGLAESRLEARVAFGGWGIIEMTDKIDFILGSFFQNQKSYNQGLLHSAIRYQLAPNGDNLTYIEVGSGIRFGDSAIPTIQVAWNAWAVGLSYDLNFSSFNVATQQRGGFEIAVRHRTVPVCAPKIKKSCPLF